MKIALAQMYVRSGNCEENFLRLKGMVEKAKNENADIIVFPELCISGAYVGDKLYDHDFCSYANSYNEKIKELSDNIGIVYGNIYYSNVLGKDGRFIKYNSIFFVKDHEYVDHGICHKNNLINAGINDDSRYFEANNTDSIFTFKKGDKDYKISLLHLNDLKCEEADYTFCLATKNWTKDTLSMESVLKQNKYILIARQN